MAEVVIEHAWRRHKVIATAMWPQGPQVAEMAFNVVQARMEEKDPNARKLMYGVDYVNLAKTGWHGEIGMGRSMEAIFPPTISQA